jgi:hypothetical protein
MLGTDENPGPPASGFAIPASAIFFLVTAIALSAASVEALTHAFFTAGDDQRAAFSAIISVGLLVCRW